MSRDYGDERDEAAVMQAYERRIREYQAEVKALRVLLAGVEKAKHRSGVIVEFGFVEGKAQWVVTAAGHDVERGYAREVGEHIAKQLGDGVKLAAILLTGSSLDAERAS